MNRHSTLLLIAALPILCLIANVEASVLGNVSASMQPGTWAELETINIDATLANTGGATGTTLSYSDNAVWDPVTRKVFFVGGDHDPASGCPRFVSYTESTNTWQILPNASWFLCGTVSRMHGLNHNALDPAAGKLYHRPFGKMTVRKYDIASQTWSDLPILTSDVMGYNSCCVAIAWFPERNSLVYASIENGTLGAVVEYRETTDQWSRIAGGLPMGQYQNFGKYDPVNKVFLFGGGGADRHVYQLNSAGVVTPMANAPTNVGIQNTVITSDPVSGQYLILDNLNRFFAYDVPTDTWTQLASTPLLTPPAYNPPVHGIVVTAVPVYGVNLYARCYINDCQAYLYKHSASTPDADADGFADDSDNCTLVANPTQLDSNADGYGNRCDGDLNNSGGNVDAQDYAIFRSRLGTSNADADLNGSGGAVNAQDYAIFRALLGSPPGPSGLAP